MKKSLVALAALAAVGVASAQSTATISGQFRLGFKSDATGVNSLAPDQGSGNVMNIAVNEDLGSGLSAFASTQLRFDASHGAFRNESGKTSSLSGFHYASVGLKSASLGTVQFGRFGFDQLHGFNAFGSTGGSLTTGIDLGATENGQVRYTSPSVMGFNAVLGGSMKANNSGNAYGKQFILNYANGPMAASAIKESTAANVGAAVAGTNASTAFGASYDLGVAKLFATKATEKDASGVKKVDRYTLSAQAPVGAFVVKAGVLRDQLNANLLKKNKNSLGLDYALSKRTTVEAQTYNTGGDVKRSMYLGLKHTY